jgi:hypothetical protein
MADVYSPLTMSADDDGSTGPYVPCPSGQHPGVLVGVIDIGTHHEVFPDGKEDDVRQLVLVWEATEVEREDGQPQLLAIQARMSIRQNTKLRGLLEDWLGDEFNPERFDPRTLLGRTALLNVIQKRSNKDRPYHRITTVMGLPPRMPVSPARTPELFYATSQGDPPAEQLRGFPFVFLCHKLRPIIEAIETSAERRVRAARADGDGAAARPRRQADTARADGPATPSGRPSRDDQADTATQAGREDVVYRATATAAQAGRRPRDDQPVATTIRPSNRGVIRRAREIRDGTVTASSRAAKDRVPFEMDDADGQDEAGPQG